MRDLYEQWRNEMESFISEGLEGTTDCGEASVREDFSRWANLPVEISFEEMLQYERWYDRKHQL